MTTTKTRTTWLLYNNNNDINDININNNDENIKNWDSIKIMKSNTKIKP